MDTQGFFSRWGWMLMLGGGVFIAGYLLFGRKNKANSNVTAASVTTPGAIGANGQPVEFVPTTGDSYTNMNYQITGSNVSNVPVGDSNPVTQVLNNPPPIVIPPIIQPPASTPPPVTTPPVVVQPPPPVVTTKPPTLPPPPPVHLPPPVVNKPPVVAPPPVTPRPPAPPPKPAYQSYTIVHGDTLSGIASRFHTTWQILYNLNKSTIDRMSAQHGNPIPGGPWNNIFPSESLQVPL